MPVVVVALTRGVATADVDVAGEPAVFGEFHDSARGRGGEFNEDKSTLARVPPPLLVVAVSCGDLMMAAVLLDEAARTRRRPPLTATAVGGGSPGGRGEAICLVVLAAQCRGTGEERRARQSEDRLAPLRSKRAK